MTGRVRDRATFEALGRAPRLREGPITLRFLPGGDEPRVAYAIGRVVGNAVHRNRLRRRLREAVAHAEGDMPAGCYLVGAGPEALTMTFADLERAISELVRAAGRTR